MPHLEFGPFPVWIGVGGSPQSVIRAARYGFSLMLAIIGGSPARFAPFSQLFRQALESSGARRGRSGVHSPGHVAATDEQAREEFWPRYQEVIRRFSKTRGFAIPTKESFSHEIGPQGALYVGSPETVAQKIAANLTALDATRFDLKFGMGGLSHQALMTNIELYGTGGPTRARTPGGNARRGQREREAHSFPKPAPPLAVVRKGGNDMTTQNEAGVARVPTLSTWQLDPAHTLVEFSGKHMMFTTVKGHFKSVRGPR